MTQATTPTFCTWALVEIFGHERIAGEVSEQVIAGEGFIRVDVPALAGTPAFTRLYGGKAIYSITPVSEAVARLAAGTMRARPVTIYLAPGLADSGRIEEAGDDLDEAGGDGFDTDDDDEDEPVVDDDGTPLF